MKARLWDWARGCDHSTSSPPVTVTCYVCAKPRRFGNVCGGARSQREKNSTQVLPGCYWLEKNSDIFLAGTHWQGVTPNFSSPGPVSSRQNVQIPRRNVLIPCHVPARKNLTQGILAAHWTDLTYPAKWCLGKKRLGLVCAISKA